MTTILGCREFTYEVVLDWAKLPNGWSFNEEVSDVAVDSQDRVYVFNRSEHPMMVFDQQGNFLTSWGEGIFKRPHGVTLGPDNTIYCVDDGDHTVRKCTLEGKVLMTLGKPGQPTAFQSGRPFNRPTKVAFDLRTGEFYVSDGYGNSRVHKYSPDGKLLFSWGDPGTEPGQFNIVHSVCTDTDGFVYVTDRENHRLQVFDPKGKYVTQWNNMHRACGLHISSGEQQLVYIGELATALAINKDVPNIGPRISIYTLKGELLVRLGDRDPGSSLNRFWSPHGLAVDSHGDIYSGKASASYTTNRPDVPMELRSFRKFVKK